MLNQTDGTAMTTPAWQVIQLILQQNNMDFTMPLENGHVFHHSSSCTDLIFT